MSEVVPPGRRRRRRVEAERSISSILDAAVRVLGERPQATVEDIATAAGVTRQTVYAHFSSRDLLIRAVIDRITEEAVAAMDAADPGDGPAASALLRVLDASWRAFERYPLLLNLAPALTQREDYDVHHPVRDRLDRLIRRGQATGEFDPGLSPTWLMAATVSLGHAAGQEVGAGRMSGAEAAAALRRSILRVFGVREPSGGPAARGRIED